MTLAETVTYWRGQYAEWSRKVQELSDWKGIADYDTQRARKTAWKQAKRERNNARRQVRHFEREQEQQRMAPERTKRQQLWAGTIEGVNEDATASVSKVAEAYLAMKGGSMGSGLLAGEDAGSPGVDDLLDLLGIGGDDGRMTRPGAPGSTATGDLATRNVMIGIGVAALAIGGIYLATQEG